MCLNNNNTGFVCVCRPCVYRLSVNNMHGFSGYVSNVCMFSILFLQYIIVSSVRVFSLGFPFFGVGFPFSA